MDWGGHRGIDKTCGGFSRSHQVLQIGVHIIEGRATKREGGRKPGADLSQSLAGAAESDRTKVWASEVGVSTEK